MTTEQLEIRFKGYTVAKSLAKNKNHEILLAKRDSDQQKVVLKTSVLKTNGQVVASKSGHEFDILKNLDHNGIVKAYEIIKNENQVALVLEYIKGKDLSEQIYKKQLPIAKTLDIAIQLPEILREVHS